MATITTFALFQTVWDAERAIGALQDHGVPSHNIGIAGRRPAEQDESERIRTKLTRFTDQEDIALGEPEVRYAEQPGTLPPAIIASSAVPTSSVDTPTNVEAVGKDGITTTTPQDAAAGAAVGTGIGLVAGLLATAAALTIPGVGLILAGGTLAAAFGSTLAATAAGAALGGVTGYLRDFGMPENAATKFADRVHEGDYLLTVHIDQSDYDTVKQILLKYNASGVDVAPSVGGANLDGFQGEYAPAIEQMHRGAAIQAQELHEAPVVIEPVTVVTDAGAGPGTRVAVYETPVITPGSDLVVPQGSHLVTQYLDGTPVVPARVEPNE